ncbi:MAG: MSMEG_1061 family FMN-dependent PPOX-type flavoprotein [Acidimicrobiia bacterium]
MTAHRLTTAVVDSEAALRALIGHPTDVVCAKVADRLNELTREYVERSPFLLIATSDRQGTCDVSPRGDPAGFVRILDDATLLLPERPGNRIADTLTNIIANPQVGLLFIVPGATETFRVNGRATITNDAALLAPAIIEGKLPTLGIIVDIDEAYTQCSKAVLRSNLWDPTRFVSQHDLPSNGAIQRAIRVTRGEHGFDADAYDAERAERYARRDGFY